MRAGVIRVLPSLPLDAGMRPELLQNVGMGKEAPRGAL